jgi:hypothetical protein
MKIRVSAFLMAFAVGSIALLPKVSAVSPAPNGGYPGGNTAEGQNALFSLTTGAFNTAAGFLSLRSDTVGAFNTGIGAGTLLANIGDENTATGAGALLSNTAGVQNTADGAFALFNNTTGGVNTATGHNALLNNTTGSWNTASGARALLLNTTGNGNTAHGGEALFTNTTGQSNTAIGATALLNNTTGDVNKAIGAGALYNNTIGTRNTASGVNALPDSDVGNSNTADGTTALFQNTSGSNNTATGDSALFNNTTGSNNSALGVGAGMSVTTADNVICIGANIAAANISNTCFIGNIRAVTTQNNDAIPVLVDSAGQLGTVSSSRRYKTDIKPIEKGSESILALKPVSFRYKVHKDMRPQFGLIAEEVAKVNPDLVIYDADGKPYTVRYDAVNAMLLNEFLKEHRIVQEQRATIAQLRQDFQSMLAKQQKQIEALTAGLQKVSAQTEASKPALQVVSNNE